MVHELAAELSTEGLIRSLDISGTYMGGTYYFLGLCKGYPHTIWTDPILPSGHDFFH